MKSGHYFGPSGGSRTHGLMDPKMVVKTIFHHLQNYIILSAQYQILFRHLERYCFQVFQRHLWYFLWSGTKRGKRRIRAALSMLVY